ncbi:glycerophosphodiester phosphodiesterase family protein [Pseudomonas sp. GZD-222]|uniref:glycerophosphodiester phosphodiesterase family protein n=1 Tax=Pseudomonas sp. GZD-222 TaxID=3404805 RepID=UPI003BB79C3D
MAIGCRIAMLSIKITSVSRPLGWFIAFPKEQSMSKMLTILSLVLSAIFPLVADARTPWIIAHRAGTADYPENTLLAIRQALINRADGIWLTVQLSSDQVPVLYRPQDLSTLTQGRGPVSSLTVEQLSQLNAAWSFTSNSDQGREHPYRQYSRDVAVPTLEQALNAIPPNIPIILDLKALPAESLVHAVASVIERKKEWGRVLFYSTEASFQSAWESYPNARLFEVRDVTRTRLLTVALEQRCESPPQDRVWTAFELRRKLDVVEAFTLGEGRSQVVSASLWTPQAISCFRSSNQKVPILWIGVNSEADYRRAINAGVNAVLVDSPALARLWSNYSACAGLCQ